MVVYAIIEITIEDNETYLEYVKTVRSIVEQHHGRHLIRGGTVSPLSGDWRPERLVVIEFPSSTDLRRCFRSPEYKRIASLRECSTTSKVVMVEGFSSCIQDELGTLRGAKK
jgi:uncharacterized protein (DUF1330 family)